MFNLYFDSSMLTNTNVIQFEYWVSEENAPLPALLNGFIPTEDAVTTQGISNQCVIAIPSSNNDYDPSTPLEVKVRVYFGQTTTSSPEINVSSWSNTCPLHNAPPQTGTPTAYLVRGEYTPTYYVGDVLYVQIPDNSAYVQGEIDFVVSYSYTDENGDAQWVVSTPLSSWTRHTFTNPSIDAILLPEILLPSDVAYQNPIYVAVNAVYNYTFNSVNYYSVSEISTTVQATDASLANPTLETIIIPDDYLVYSNPSTQQIILNWLPPSSSLIPTFTVNSYTIEMSVGGVVVDTITGIPSSTLDYTYPIPSAYVNASTTTTLQFNIVAVFNNGQTGTSNAQYVNTFTYATAPQNLIVAWANSGVGSGNMDIALQFENPQSNGFGSVINFVVNVINNNVTVYSQTVPYVAGTAPYSVYLVNVAAATEGSVEVYMVTQDTNQQTVGGSYASLNGASASQNYVADDLPIMLSYSRTSTQLTAVWVTHTLLDAICTFNYWDPTLSQLNNLQYATLPDIIYPNHTVAVEPLSTLDFQYTFTFQNTFFPSSTIPNRMVMNCSNSVGIGFGNVSQ